ncbi:aminotransferase class V-fold PLP-dependent enzyme [Nocardia sp. NPDC051990]|uniref:aminotransferase class V-fold PLP-dependent enzyme n=1 Tax=Nocardia sp. NPDC051990 TaxID=3155285 RepID=UPI00342D95F7
MTPEEFRANFPALETWTWLDTPGAPPGATPVVTALRQALDDWSSGSFDWLDWDHAVDAARSDFARYIGVGPDTIASQTSLAEASTVAVRSTAPGTTIVVAEDEFRSVLFPAHHYHAATGTDLCVVARQPGSSRTAAIIDAIGPNTGLVMVSEVLTNDGELVDIEAICHAAHQYDALVYANLTQSLGVLRSDLARHPADIIAAHGYKWMLCPRGTTWLVADPARAELQPTVASWKTTRDAEHYFGGPYTESATMTRCNSSPAWISWIGARAALSLLSQISEDESRRHTLGLASDYTRRMRENGFRPLNNGAPSHIVVTAPPEYRRIDPAALRKAKVRATLTESGALRVGFHYFNTDTDVDHVIEAAASALVP